MMHVFPDKLKGNEDCQTHRVVSSTVEMYSSHFPPRRLRMFIVKSLATHTVCRAGPHLTLPYFCVYPRLFLPRTLSCVLFLY